MRQFCQHALAYMTQQPLEVFEKQTMAEMRVKLLAQLHQRAWLLDRDELTRTTALLNELGVPIPKLPPTIPPRTSRSPGKPTSAPPSTS